MIKKINNSRVGLIQFECSNGFTVSIGVGDGHYCDNKAKPHGTNEPTATMEVAIMDGHSFVVLPHDVAGYVPVSNLCYILAAVEDSNWERVCSMCSQNTEDPLGKFPVPA